MAKRGRPPYPDVLTPREWEVLSLLRENLTNEQIAERLGVTLHAARYHVSQILSKLAVATREEAAAWQPEPVRAAPRWSIAFQVWLTAAATVAIIAVGVLAWGVARGSGDDAQVGDVSASPTATLAATAAPTESPPPSFIPFPRPDLGANVRSMQLVGEDAGFVLTDDALLRTPFIPAGEKIEVAEVDITPPGVAITDIRGFRFLNAQRGWLVASGTPDDASQTLQLLVFRTADGGDSWQSSSFSDGGFVYYENRSRAASIYFVDAGHGWIVLDTMATMNSPAGDLFRTDDSGQTWTKLTVPAGDPIYFTDQQTGWQTASPCSTCPISQLHVTHDGGETWTDASDITPLAEPAGPRAFGLPVALDDGSLMLPVTMYIQDHPSLFMLYSSTDGGQVWQQVALTEIGDAISQGFPVPAFIFASGTVVAIAPDGSGYRLAAGGNAFEQFTPAQTGDVRNPFSQTGFFSPANLDFLDEQHGWGIAFAGGCQQFKADCWDATFIEQTEDGGLTWSPLPFGSTPTP